MHYDLLQSVIRSLLKIPDALHFLARTGGTREILKPLASACLLAVLVIGCGDPIDQHIDQLVKGGKGAEDAKMALSLARGTAIAPLIAAFNDLSHPPRARVDMADALYRLYIREKDAAILQTLIGALEDTQADVRTQAARVLGDLGKRVVVEPMIDRLAREPEHPVRLEILVGLGFMSLADAPQGGFGGSQMTTDMLEAAQKQRFIELLVEMSRQDLS
jgi:hypothetical protein